MEKGPGATLSESVHTTVVSLARKMLTSGDQSPISAAGVISGSGLTLLQGVLVAWYFQVPGAPAGPINLNAATGSEVLHSPVV